MLTRYACYLVAQNGDPRKPQIAFAQTEMLVVIGYSMPPVNRAIDMKLLRGMKNIKSIVIQDKNCDIVKQHLAELLDDNQKKAVMNNISFVSDLSAFYIPTSII